jgi:hypothetical protein
VRLILVLLFALTGLAVRRAHFRLDRARLTRPVSPAALGLVFVVLVALAVGVMPGVLYAGRVPVLAPLACQLHGGAWVSADRILSDQWNSYPSGPGCYRTSHNQRSPATARARPPGAG